MEFLSNVKSKLKFCSILLTIVLVIEISFVALITAYMFLEETSEEAWIFLIIAAFLLIPSIVVLMLIGILQGCFDKAHLAKVETEPAPVVKQKPVDYLAVFSSQSVTPINSDLEFISMWLRKKICQQYPVDASQRIARNNLINQVINGVMGEFVRVKAPSLTKSQLDLCLQIIKDAQAEINLRNTTEVALTVKIIVYLMEKESQQQDLPMQPTEETESNNSTN